MAGDDVGTGGGGFLRGYGAFWLYTLLRFALFFVLWGVVWLVGVGTIPVLFAGLIALVLSVPLSWVLLAKPRRAFAATIEQRVDRRRERTHDLDARLAGETPVDDDDAAAADDTGEPDRSRGRSKRR